ncbi:uncharacterized protein KQ657_002421 [Scheffersomyces spartinae]|uniref:Alpha/beta hydrolase fold-3 domain-containing protein n=1 Tax=Scheffersomyces spartinae TaxID=45513 RepID=A0A9P7V6A0_9ASCO|nr:uncharacterized protein KQ657_002421 [Scheffersomyces spartinae]KAG7192063.1 hypothetical protein KQ657_002421 [Scheffersomyces spartinae]
MPTLSLIIGLLSLPLKLLQVTLAYFTIGTVFKNDTTKKSLRRTWNCAIFQHMTKRLRLSDIKLHAMYTVEDLLNRMDLKLSNELPGYGVRYSSKLTDDVDDTSVDSYWLTLQELRCKSDPIILYIHGGCFAIQLQDVAVEAMANVYRALKQEFNKTISMLIVDYSLSSNGVYFPNQYHQVNWLYDKLVSEGNTNIVVMGDSAGGNLTLNILHHLSCDKSLSTSTVWPAGIIPISPMMNVCPSERTGSYITYADYDVFSYDCVDYFGTQYIHKDFSQAMDDPRVNIALNVDDINWKEIPTIKQGRMLMVFE